MKKLLVFVLVMVLVTNSYCLIKVNDKKSNIFNSFQKIISLYWKIQDCRWKSNSNLSTFEETSYEYKYAQNRLLRYIFDKIDGINYYEELYYNLPDISKNAFSRVNKLINEKLLFENKSVIRFRNSQRKTEYIYRLGKELDRELIKAEWIIERRTYFKNVKVEIVVDDKVLKPLKILYPAIFILKLGKWLINGEFHFAFKTTFTTKEKLFFRTVKKIAKNKVWFEVWRAKKTWFTSPKWELYGKTYKIITEPTGEELANEVKVLED